MLKGTIIFYIKSHNDETNRYLFYISRKIFNIEYTLRNFDSYPHINFAEHECMQTYLKKLQFLKPSELNNVILLFEPIPPIQHACAGGSARHVAWYQPPAEN